MSQAFDSTRVTITMRAVTAIICGAWLWMFLPPMDQLHLVNNATSFSVLFYALMLAQLLPWRWTRVVIGLAASEWYVVHYYASGVDLLNGIFQVTAVEWEQLRFALNNMGNGLADPLQTHLFLWCICAMYWLIVYASTRTRLWVFYNVLAVLVFAIVDGNTSIHPNVQIVVILMLLVINLGFIQYRKLRGHFERAMYWAPTGRYFTPLGILLVVGVVLGISLPKHGPQWMDPSKAFAAWKGNAPGNAVQMIGYQENNTHLGGSFVMNHEQVLSVVTKYPTYLRGQVYSVYTGKGWNTEYTRFATVPVGNSFAEYGVDANKIKGKVVQQTITLESDSLHPHALLGAYSLQNVNALSLPPGAVMQVAPDTDVVYAPPVNKGESYTVTSYEMNNPYQVLGALPPLPKNYSSAFPDDIRREYLLLPTIPDRVAQLAKQAAGNSSNEYQIVTNIRDYLRLNYTYQTDGIPVPGPKDDYVDQFLFESKKGYCNNFSSAMAVMLRSLGIPTRWVTGFAEGTLDVHYTGKDSRYTYENSDAHSWVEVYFPSLGWIPFDPTPNFTMSYTPADQTPSGSTPSSPTTPAAKPPLHNLQQDPGSTGAASGTWNWGNLLKTVLWILAGVAVLLLLVLYLFRRKVREVRHAWVWRHLTARAMLRGLQHLVYTLRRLGRVKSKAPTLRELHTVAKSYGVSDDEYRHLVRTAESHWYGGKPATTEDLERARSTWKAWMLNILRRS